MAFSVKDWRDSPDATTPLSATALENLETRLSGYTDLRSPALNVKLDYGAVGDDAADDTTAIQTALNDAGSSPTVRAVFLPAGNYRVGPLTVPANVTLFGVGVGGSILRAKAGITSNSWLVSQSTPSTVTIRDLQIDGRDTGTNVGGLDFAGDWCCAQNILVLRMTGTGVRLHNYSGNSLVNVNSWKNAGHGFDLGPDCTVVNCQAATNGQDGFYLQGNTQLANCKAYWNGWYNNAVNTAAITAGYGNGFHWKGGATYSVSVGLSAQDNAACGLKLNGAYSVVVTGFIADSNNNRTGGTSSNVQLTGNAGNNILIGQSVDRAANAPNIPDSAVAIGGGCQDNTVEIRTAGLSNQKIATGSEVYRNNLVVDGSRNGSQGVPYAASVTVDPTLGNMVDIGPLTGNISITLPAWTTTDPITLLFQQDGTGGRTITWNGNILTAWQPDAAANARSSITIRYDADVARWKPVAYFKGTP